MMKRYFTNVTSYTDLKKQYRTLIKENHPDNGGTTEAMQEINVQFEALFKIWKDRRSTEETTEETNNETAQNLRRDYYTANGWEGSRYDEKMTLKDIANIVRAYAKEKYPLCKFSIRTKYASMCQKLIIDFKEFNGKMYKTADDLRAEGITHEVSYNGSTWQEYNEDINEMFKKLRMNGMFAADTWNDDDLLKAYDKATKESTFYAIRTELFKAVFEDVTSFAESYNYSYCDGMIDRRRLRILHPQP